MNVGKFAIGATSALAALVFTGCSSFESPRQVEASNPTVTYKYHNDNELVQTNDLAMGFCSRYQSVPHSIRFARDGDDDIVVYECVSHSRSSLANATFNLDHSYTYRTDRELLEGSQDAQAYCMSTGSSRVVSSIVRNGDGTRTVMFQCRPS